MTRSLLISLLLTVVCWTSVRAADSQRGTTQRPTRQETAYPFQGSALVKALLTQPDSPVEAPMPQRRSGSRGTGSPSISGGAANFRPAASQSVSGELPTVTRSFAALGDNGQSIPPDTHGAAGPNHLMVTLNTEVRVQDRTGSTLSTVTLNQFWAGLTSQAFDPKVMYDHQAGRWMVTAMANSRSASSAVLMGVSATDDPTGAWYLYSIDADGQNTTWADYPSIGYNKDWIAVQVNMFTVSNSQYRVGKIYVFNKSDLYANGPGQHTVFLDSLGFTQVPAITYDDTLSTLYLVDQWLPEGDETQVNRLRISTITGPVGTEIYTPKTDTVVTADFWADTPPVTNFAPQSGTTNKVTTNDARMHNVVYRNGALWCTHHVYLPNNAPTRSSIQWWQVSVTGDILQRGLVDDPTNGFFYAFPSIAVNRNNDVLIGYSSFSLSQFPSAGYSFRNSGDPSGTLQPSTVFKAGEAKYFKTFSGTRNRWGDYSNTQVDPIDDTAFWTIQQYAANPAGGVDRWGTWWAQVTPPLLLPNLSVTTPSLVLGFAAATDTLTGTFTIRNTGSGLLVLDTLFTGTTPFSVSPTGDVLNPFDSLLVTVMFVSPTHGNFADTVFVASNDAITPLLKLPVQAATIRDGDSDYDGFVNVVDIVQLVRFILRQASPPSPSSLTFRVLDLNRDLRFDVLDVVKIVRIVLGASARVTLEPVESNASLSVAPANVLPDGRSEFPLTIQSDGSLAGLQFTLSYDPQLATPDLTTLPVNVRGLNLMTHASVGSLRMVLVSLEGRLLPAGEVTINGVIFTPRSNPERAKNPFVLTEAVAGDVFARPVPVRIGSDLAVEQPIPTRFSIENARPNPFNPSTTISYDVASATHIVIAVYNLLGQEVIRLVDRVAQPGKYDISWDARNADGRPVASGVYVYRLMTGTGFLQSRRLTLLR